MNTLTQEFQNETEKAIKTMYVMIPEMQEQIEALKSPVNFSRSIFSYTAMISGIDMFIRKFGCMILRRILEQMDRTFRLSAGRTERYYIAQTRPRTIDTLIGTVTYMRTEYRDRSTRKPFIYVDEKIGLLRRMRYDACIQARAYELYSNHNSMAKVGEIIGQQIHSFSLKNGIKLQAISRQEIWKMINRFAYIRTKPSESDETPDTLYIMADEKYIHLQQEMDSWKRRMEEEGKSADEIRELAKSQHFAAMTKLAVIFEGREELTNKSGKHLKRRRWRLTGRHFFAWPHKTNEFWGACHDYIGGIYDLSKVKNIYILGDGASWIKSGVHEMRTADTESAYALDRYHATKYIHKITKDSQLRKTMYEYLCHGMRKDLNLLIDSVIENDPSRKESIEECRKYLLSNIKGALIMHNEVKIGCAMEQAICHVYASSFSSVPKAYSRDHLANYVDARIHQQNGENMELLYISALQQLVSAYFKNGSGSSAADMWQTKADIGKTPVGLGSLFDSPATDPTYKVSFPFEAEVTPF